MVAALPAVRWLLVSRLYAAQFTANTVSGQRERGSRSFCGQELVHDRLQNSKLPVFEAMTEEPR